MRRQPLWLDEWLERLHGREQGVPRPALDCGRPRDLANTRPPAGSASLPARVLEQDRHRRGGTTSVERSDRAMPARTCPTAEAPGQVGGHLAGHPPVPNITGSTKPGQSRGVDALARSTARNVRPITDPGGPVPDRALHPCLAPAEEASVIAPKPELARLDNPSIRGPAVRTRKSPHLARRPGVDEGRFRHRAAPTLWRTPRLRGVRWVGDAGGSPADTGGPRRRHPLLGGRGGRHLQRRRWHPGARRRRKRRRLDRRGRDRRRRRWPGERSGAAEGRPGRNHRKLLAASTALPGGGRRWHRRTGTAPWHLLRHASGQP